jgi:hypothetical protein
MFRFQPFTRAAVETHRLDRDATLKLQPRRGHVIVAAEAGTCLVTQEGDPADHVVAPGESFTSRTKGAIAVWAFTPATIAIARLPAGAAP